MNITISVEGTTPLLMHNPRMADPEYELARELKAVAAKRKKTDEDRAKMETLEWFGGLYVEDGRIVQPTSKVRKCLIEAARISKLGKNVERALVMSSIHEALRYEGPEDPKEVYATGDGYVSRLSVRVSQQRVMRVRPQFMPWALSIPAVLIEDAGLNYDELERIVDLAGISIGIGDNRVNGYGRFVGKVEQA